MVVAAAAQADVRDLGNSLMDGVSSTRDMAPNINTLMKTCEEFKGLMDQHADSIVKKDKKLENAEAGYKQEVSELKAKVKQLQNNGSGVAAAGGGDGKKNPVDLSKTSAPLPALSTPRPIIATGVWSNKPGRCTIPRLGVADPVECLKAFAAYGIPPQAVSGIPDYPIAMPYSLGGWWVEPPKLEGHSYAGKCFNPVKSATNYGSGVCKKDAKYANPDQNEEAKKMRDTCMTVQWCYNTCIEQYARDDKVLIEEKKTPSEPWTYKTYTEAMEKLWKNDDPISGRAHSCLDIVYNCKRACQIGGIQGGIPILDKYFEKKAIPGKSGAVTLEVKKMRVTKTARKIAFDRSLNLLYQYFVLKTETCWTNSVGQQKCSVTKKCVTLRIWCCNGSLSSATIRGADRGMGDAPKMWQTGSVDKGGDKIAEILRKKLNNVKTFIDKQITCNLKDWGKAPMIGDQMKKLYKTMPEIPKWTVSARIKRWNLEGVCADTSSGVTVPGMFRGPFCLDCYASKEHVHPSFLSMVVAKEKLIRNSMKENAKGIHCQKPFPKQDTCGNDKKSKDARRRRKKETNGDDKEKPRATKKEKKKKPKTALPVPGRRRRRRKKKRRELGENDERGGGAKKEAPKDSEKNRPYKQLIKIPVDDLIYDITKSPRFLFHLKQVKKNLGEKNVWLKPLKEDIVIKDAGDILRAQCAIE